MHGRSKCDASERKVRINWRKTKNWRESERCPNESAKAEYISRCVCVRMPNCHRLQILCQCKHIVKRDSERAPMHAWYILYIACVWMYVYVRMCAPAYIYVACVSGEVATFDLDFPFSFNFHSIGSTMLARTHTHAYMWMRMCMCEEHLKLGPSVIERI